MFQAICQICNRAFASPKGKTLSSKRIGGAILLTSAILKGFIVLAVWIILRIAIPQEIVQIIDAELIAGTTALGATIFEKRFKNKEQ
jgi:ABC-type phosphate transport system permease subunit